MTSMKTLMLGLSAAALTIGGVACAQAPANDKSQNEAGREYRHGRPKMEDNRTITRAEAQTRAIEMFARLDVNKDGKLDKADRELMHQQMREKMFDRLDTNHDGSISKAEFMADRGPEGRGPGRHGPEGRGPDGRGPDGRGPGAPDGADAPPPPPGEGAPDGPPRFRGGPAKFQHGMGRSFGGMMKGADGDGDRAITQAEFVAAALKRFDAEDANHDGKVTPEERRAARKAHMEERKARWEARKAQTEADKPAGN